MSFLDNYLPLEISNNFKVLNSIDKTYEKGESSKMAKERKVSVLKVMDKEVIHAFKEVKVIKKRKTLAET